VKGESSSVFVSKKEKKKTTGGEHGGGGDFGTLNIEQVIGRGTTGAVVERRFKRKRQRKVEEGGGKG